MHTGRGTANRARRKSRFCQFLGMFSELIIFEEIVFHDAGAAERPGRPLLDSSLNARSGVHTVIHRL